MVSTPSTRSTNFAGVQIGVEYVAPDLLLSAPRQLRRRSVRQARRLAQSISDFGFLVPVLIDDGMQIMAGHGRVEAAKQLGLTAVPAIRIEHLTEAQRRLFAIADNVAPEGVQWEAGALLLELQDIQLLEPQIDLTKSGLSIVAIDTMFGRARTEELAEADDAQPEIKLAAVSRPGDCYQLGRHVLGCGDARDPDFIASIVGETAIRLVLSDPPWNLKIEGVVSGKGKHKHLDFAFAAGEMTRPAFVQFLVDSLASLEPMLIDGALLYLFIDWRSLDALDEAAAARKLEKKNLLVWCKDNAGLGGLYRSQHELVGLYKFGTAPHLNNIRMGEDGRNRTNVLHYPGANTFVKGRAAALAAHPTSKPVAILADIILDVTAPGDVVLDMFGGSGSTLIAAERMNRACRMLELHPPYVDGIIRRYEKLTNTSAVHIATGLTFEQLAEQRSVVVEAGETADD